MRLGSRRPLSESKSTTTMPSRRLRRKRTRRSISCRRFYFGAWVQLETAGGELRWYRLVGPDEFDMASNYVSMDSPLGRTLLGKRLDDEVTLGLPTGAHTFTVTAISYGPRP